MLLYIVDGAHSAMHSLDLVLTAPFSGITNYWHIPSMASAEELRGLHTLHLVLW